MIRTMRAKYAAEVYGLLFLGNTVRQVHQQVEAYERTQTCRMQSYVVKDAYPRNK